MSVHYNEHHVSEGQGSHENENKLYIHWTFKGFDETFALLWCEATDKRLAFDMWLITEPLFGEECWHLVLVMEHWSETACVSSWTVCKNNLIEQNGKQWAGDLLMSIMENLSSVHFKQIM